MTTFMTRKAAEFWWKQKLPPNVAYLTKRVSNEPAADGTISEHPKMRPRADHHDCKLKS